MDNPSVTRSMDSIGSANLSMSRTTKMGKSRGAKKRLPKPKSNRDPLMPRPKPPKRDMPSHKSIPKSKPRITLSDDEDSESEREVSEKRERPKSDSERDDMEGPEDPSPSPSSNDSDESSSSSDEDKQSDGGEVGVKLNAKRRRESSSEVEAPEKKRALTSRLKPLKLKSPKKDKKLRDPTVKFKDRDQQAAKALRANPPGVRCIDFDQPGSVETNPSVLAGYLGLRSTTELEELLTKSETAKVLELF